MVQPPVIGGDRGTWGQKLIDWVISLTENSVSQAELDALESTVSGNILAIETLQGQVAIIPTVEGAPTDDDVDSPVDGAMALDTTNDRLYVRSGGTWMYATLT